MKEEETTKHTRIRQYGKNYKGEIIVFIHAAGDGLKTQAIYKELFNNFEFISQVTLVNKNKIKVLFKEKESKSREEAIEEANTLANSALKGCSIYIPAKLVEVQGVVSWPISEKIDDFVKSGNGKFKDPRMSNVKVLDSIRLKRKSNEASNNPGLEDTSVIIITFQGNLLPDTLEVDRLLIPVREYRRREMFCVNCRKLGHTQKMCNNKKLENPTFLCMQCNTNDHLGGSTRCPRRKTLEKKHMMTMRKLRTHTYAEMLKELDEDGVAHETPIQPTAPPMTFPTRKEEVASKNAAKKADSIVHKTQRPARAQNQPSTSSTNKYPPGFKKSSDNSTNANQREKPNPLKDMIIDKLKYFMQEHNIPPGFQNFILTNFGQLIDELFKKFTDSINKTIDEFCKVR
jgi:hypothetical protein